MKLAGKFTLIALICGFVSSLETCDGIDIALTGASSVLIDAGDLTGGAGTDLAGTYESACDQMAVTISSAGGNGVGGRIGERRNLLGSPPAALANVLAEPS